MLRFRLGHSIAGAVRGRADEPRVAFTPRSQLSVRQVLLVWLGVDRRRDFAMASEDDSFKSTSQLLRDDSFKNSPLVTSKLSGSGSFKGQFTETENTRRRCAVFVALARRWKLKS